MYICIMYVCLHTKHYLAWGGESITPPPIVFLRYLKKYFELGSSNFLAFLTNTTPHLRLTAGLLLGILIKIYFNSLDFNIL